MIFTHSFNKRNFLLKLFFGTLPIEMRPNQARSLAEVCDDENIGAAISKIRRLLLRESQARFAGKIGLTREQLANVETGRTSISARLGWEFCHRFNVHPDWIINGGGPQEEPEKFGTIPVNVTRIGERILAEHAEMKFRQFCKMLRLVEEINNSKFILDIDKTRGNVCGVKAKVPTWTELRQEIIRFTCQRGQKSALARKMKISRQVLGNWLSGEARGAPNAEQTLWLLTWIEQQQKRQQ
jgi:transcriptional regulator with XRE-family HTH domain